MIVWDVLGFILVFGSVLFLAYITTKILGNKTAKSMKGTYMEIIETLRLGNDKQLVLVKAGDKFIIMSSSSKGLDFICEVNIDYTEAKEPIVGPTGANFKEILDKYIGVIPFKGKDKQNRINYDLNFEKNISKLQQINSKFGNEDGADEIK